MPERTHSSASKGVLHGEPSGDSTVLIYHSGMTWSATRFSKPEKNLDPGRFKVTV